MAKLTVLEIVQSILNDLDGDEVNTINDTTESVQVAQIVKDTYTAIMSNRDWKHTRRLLSLVASGDVNLPTHMSFAENVKKLDNISYNKADATETQLKFQRVEWRDPDDFLRISSSRNNDEDNVTVVTDPSGIILMVMNDAHPNFYTTFDDQNIVFDAYDSTVDSTLQASKTQAMGFIIPEFVLSDTHVSDLHIDAFTYLLEEAKSRCALKLRQQQDSKAEAESVRQNRWLSRQNQVVDKTTRKVNYGRNTNGGRFRLDTRGRRVWP